MATLAAYGAALSAPGAAEGPNTANFCTGQTATGATTNVIDRGAALGPILVKAAGLTGGTSATVYFEGSVDAANWYSIQFALSTTPGTLVLGSASAQTVSAATTVFLIIGVNVPARFVRGNFQTNAITNGVTMDGWVF